MNLVVKYSNKMTIFGNMQRNSTCNSTRNNVAEQRLRMRDWLELRIGDPRYPGLVWVNKNQKIFRIPWKHGARHGWRPEEDARLFRDWSEHTGASPRDIKQHKANFRCALNSLRDIRKLTDLNKSKGDDAYRVYQILPKSHCKSNKRWIRKRKVCKRDNLNHEAERSTIPNTRISGRKLSVPYSEHFHFPKCIVNNNSNYEPICSNTNFNIPDNSSTSPYFPNDYYAQHKYSCNSPAIYNNQRHTSEYQTPADNEQWQMCNMSVADHLSEANAAVTQKPAQFFTEHYDYSLSYNNNSFQFNSYAQSHGNYNESIPSAAMTPPAESHLFSTDYNYMSDESGKNLYINSQENYNAHNYGTMSQELKPTVAIPNGEGFAINDFKNQPDCDMKTNTQNLSYMHTNESYKSYNQNINELETPSPCCTFKSLKFLENAQVKRERVVCSPVNVDNISYQTNSDEDLSVQCLNTGDTKAINTNHNDFQFFAYDVMTPSPSFCDMESYDSNDNPTTKLPSASTLLNLSNRLLCNPTNKCIPTKIPFSISHVMSPAVVYGQ